MDRLCGQKHLLMVASLQVSFFVTVFIAGANPATSTKLKETALEQFENHCFDCHDGEAKKGDLDLVSLLGKDDFDGSLMFEHLIKKYHCQTNATNCPDILA